MLSMGYSILFNEILSNIIAIGLHPYIGFFHQLAKGHPALVSDLIEEWRAVIVDALVISLIKRGSITENMFTLNKKGCYFSVNTPKTTFSNNGQIHIRLIPRIIPAEL